MFHLLGYIIPALIRVNFSSLKVAKNIVKGGLIFHLLLCLDFVIVIIQTFCRLTFALRLS